MAPFYPQGPWLGGEVGGLCGPLVRKCRNSPRTSQFATAGMQQMLGHGDEVPHCLYPMSDGGDGITGVSLPRAMGSLMPPVPSPLFSPANLPSR